MPRHEAVGACTSRKTAPSGGSSTTKDGNPLRESAKTTDQHKAEKFSGSHSGKLPLATLPGQQLSESRSLNWERISSAITASTSTRAWTMLRRDGRYNWSRSLAQACVPGVILPAWQYLRVAVRFSSYAHHSCNGFHQLYWVITDAVFENQFDCFDIYDVFGVSLEHHQVCGSSDGNRTVIEHAFVLRAIVAGDLTCLQHSDDVVSEASCKSFRPQRLQRVDPCGSPGRNIAGQQRCADQDGNHRKYRHPIQTARPEQQMFHRARRRHTRAGAH
jgi:hypothetical protein